MECGTYEMTLVANDLFSVDTSVIRGVDPYGTQGTCPPNIYEGGDVYGNVPPIF